ncbi:MAG: hypothetical protein PCFJNLEI_02123 [Verrucomicrobiae bacterium]|nr:hypothetical protein [Verrucomicrobiae bacterium]
MADPHGGWGGLETSSGWYWETYNDGAGNFPPADGPPGRHVYRGLGQLWATGYTQREVMLDPDFMNNLDSSCISYRGAANWRGMYTTRSLVAPGWSSGTYVFYSWSYRPGIRGNGPRLLDWSKPLTTGLLMCRQAGLDATTAQIPLGAHRRRAVNSCYEDGHVSMLPDLQKVLAYQAATAANWQYNGNESTIWGYWWGGFIAGR